MPARLVLGAMTGTSIDGIDLALVRIEGAGLKMRAKFVAGRSAELGAHGAHGAHGSLGAHGAHGSLAAELKKAATQQPLTAAAWAALASELGSLHAREAKILLAERGGGAPLALAAVHGQTLFHAPPLSCQLINPFPIAAALECPVVCELRQADLVAGGQGAPITPLADWVLLRAPHARVVVNLGGFCNITALPAETEGAESEGADSEGADSAAGADSEGAAAAGASLVTRIRGADLCACNQLLDRAAERVLGQPFDRDGARALAGRADAAAVGELTALLTLQRHAKRSLGTGDEACESLRRLEERLRGDDLLATLTASIGAAIAAGVLACEPNPGDVIVAGGGVFNRALMAALRRDLPVPVRSSDEVGLPPAMREAAGIAVLGALAQDGVPITLPQVTRRNHHAGADGLWCHPRGQSGKTGPA